MLALGLVLLPLAMAFLTYALPAHRLRPYAVLLTAALHLGLSGLALTAPEVTALDRWLVLDPLGKLLLGLTSTVFFLCAVYAPGYLAQRTDKKNRTFSAGLLGLLAMLSLMILSHHLGLMWVAMEASTLMGAPLLYFNQNPRSLEATWKYLLIGSVGIATALLGSLFLAYSSLHGGAESTLLFEDLVANAQRLSPPWLHAAFVLLLVGYGTKMGLAPMHTWKPDAYGEAPALVGALLAGAVTACAFLAVLRFYQICHAAGQEAVPRGILVFMGLLSMLVAAVFMVRQRDLKRLLAYSSIEHMGILVLGLGVGGAAIFGSLLHLVNNGLCKGVLFLAVGNVHRAYDSKLTHEVSGVLRRLPLSGALLCAGLFAITGSPPFGPFLSEFTILLAALAQGRYLVAALYLLLLFLIFVGLGGAILAVAQGRPSERAAATPYRDSFLTGAPPLVFLALVTLLGVCIPAPLARLLREASAQVEVRAQDLDRGIREARR